MTVEYVDGIRVIRIHDAGGAARHDDGLAMLRIWQLLTGGHAMRDVSAVCRRF